MNISYQGIGQWCATFAGEGIEEGTVVKIGANSTVRACEAGDAFCGTAAAVSRDGKAHSVQLRGFVTVKYTGAPTLGYCTLTADGKGGVKNAESAESGRSVLVVEKDETAGTVTIML